MKTTYPLLVVAASVTLLSLCQAAPKRPIDTYDKRQDGKFNVDTKLNNILFLVAPAAFNTGNLDVSGLIENAILAQSLGMRNSIPRNADHPENDEINAKSEDSVQNSRQELPGKTVEEPEGNAKLAAVPEASELSQPQSNLKKEKEVQESIEKSKKSARSLKKPSRELLVSKLPPIQKQLTLENKVSPGQNEREDSVGLADREPQELKLIGGGIENCGPDRFRDRFGICQARVEKQ